MSDDEGISGATIGISDDAYAYLVRLLTQPGPALVHETSERTEIMEALLGVNNLSSADHLKLTAEIERSAQQTLPKSVSIDVIIQTVIYQFSGITEEDLRGARRNYNVVLARHIAMLLIFKLVKPRPSYERIAERFNCDHTTVISAVKSATEAINRKPYVCEIVEKILQSLSWRYEDVFGAV